MLDPLKLPEPSAAIHTSRVLRNPAVIRSQRPLTHDTFELVVVCADTAPPIHAHAGQFATLRFPGIKRPRPYSFARDPRAEKPGEHTFYIRLVADGEVSAWLAAGDRSGSELEIAGPLGEFGLDDAHAPMICIAGGSGMSAILALLQLAAATQVKRDCYFYYGARGQADLYADDEIAEIAAAWSAENSFEFVRVLSEEPADSDWQGARGFVTDAVKSTLLDAGRISADDASAFFCGPPPMIAAGARILAEAGMPDTKIFRDVFEDARSPAPVLDNRKCVLCDECLLVKPVDNCIVETAGLDINASGQVGGFRKLQPAHSSGLYYNTLFIDPAECIRCYACVNACPHDAISPDYGLSNTLRQQLES